MTVPTGNTAPLDHVLPDDPSAWTALDHAVATANLRGAIIARMRQEADDWRADDPPICPTCGTDCGYWAWEDRDSVRGVIRENAALRERVAATEAHRDRLLEGIEGLLDIAEQYGYRRDWAETIFVTGDLDGAGEGGNG